VAVRAGEVYMTYCAGPLLAVGATAGGSFGASIGVSLVRREDQTVPRNLHTALTLGLCSAAGMLVGGSCLAMLPLMALPLSVAYGVLRLTGWTTP